MRRPPAASASLRERRSLRRAWPCLWLAAIALSWVTDARAATVAILRPTHETREIREALSRLKGELLSVGLEVVIAERERGAGGETTSPEGRAWLERLAQEQALDAMLDVIGDPRPSGVDVWLRERGTARLDVTRVELEPSAPDAAESLAIHAIEVLRSSFLSAELGASTAPAPPAPPAPQAEAPERPRPSAATVERRLGLELGAAALAGFDGVSPSFLPMLRASLALDSTLLLTATAAGYGTRGGVEVPAGRVRVAQQFGLLGLCACHAASAGLQPMAGLSAGFLRTAVEGEASAPDVAHRAQSWSFLLEASAGVRAPLGQRYFLTLGAHLQIAQPYVAIYVVDAVVATTGRPNLLASLTLGSWL